MRRVLDAFVRSDFVRHSALAFAGTLGAQLCNFIFHVYNSRALGVERYGDLFSLINVLLIIQSVFAQIITYVMVKYAAAFHAVGDRNRLRALCERTMLWTSLACLATVLLSFALKDSTTAFLHLADARSVPALGCIAGIWLMQPSVRGVLQGAQDFRNYGIALIVEGVLLVALGCGFVAAGYGVPGALFGWALASVCSFAYGYVAARAHFGARGAALNIDLPRLAKTSGGIALTMVAMALGLSDVVLVKHFFAPEVAGLYAVVALAGRIIFFVVSFVPAVILPKVSAITARGESPVPVAARAFTALAVLAGIALICFTTVAGGVVHLLAGAMYAGAAVYILAYGFAMTLLAATQIAATYKIGIHNFSYVPWLTLAMIGELGAITLFHATLWHVIDVLILGNACAFLVTAYGIFTTNKQAGKDYSTCHDQ